MARELGLEAPGYRLLFNMGEHSGQEVPHLHVHVVPRTKGDGLRGFFWPRTKYADAEAEATAALVREALAAP